MSIAVIHDRIMDAANIESAQILLPSGSWRKQKLRVRLSAGSGYPWGRDGCPAGHLDGPPAYREGPFGRSGRPLRRRFLSEPAVYSAGSTGYLSEPAGYLSRRRGCPSGGQV
jgi:hypothetical protein